MIFGIPKHPATPRFENLLLLRKMKENMAGGKSKRTREGREGVRHAVERGLEQQ